MHTKDEVMAAAEALVAVQTRYARAGVSLAQAALAGARACVEQRHYPAADVFDEASGTEFYYHAHGSRRRPQAEHGHFHVFKRMAGADPHFCHVVALSLDDRGLPLRWFVTNRWVTGERWVAAETLLHWLPGLRPAARGRLAPVARWLAAMLVLDAGPVAALLRQRDRIIARRRADHELDALLEDRRLDVLAERAIDLPQRLARLAGLPPDRPRART